MVLTDCDGRFFVDDVHSNLPGSSLAMSSLYITCKGCNLLLLERSAQWGAGVWFWSAWARGFLRISTLLSICILVGWIWWHMPLIQALRSQSPWVWVSLICIHCDTLYYPTIKPQNIQCILVIRESQLWSPKPLQITFTSFWWASHFLKSY